MKIEKLTIVVDLEIHLSEEEELTAIEVGKLLKPDEEDEVILVQESLEYWLTLGLIQKPIIYGEKNNASMD